MAPGTCNACKDLTACPTCGQPLQGWNHVGIRMSRDSGKPSGVYHYAVPCGHEQRLGGMTVKQGQASSGLAVYNGGPLWKAGYRWQNVYWGSYWATAPPGMTVAQVDGAVSHIEADPSYSGGLSEYDVGQGAVLPSAIITNDPPSTVDDSAIGPQITAWVKAGSIPELGAEGAYNIFLPPGTTVTLQGSASCQVFCDYHNYDGTHFYTVEPYPCSAGCNQCTTSEFDTLTQGLSEEMAELKTDMNPGTGWVIGNEEVCDYCDAAFVCNQIGTGEYVNAWYSNAQGKCWGKATAPPPPGTQCEAQIEQGLSEVLHGQEAQGFEDLLGGIECLIAAGVLSRKQLIKRLFEML